MLRGQTLWNWHEDPRGRFNVYVDYENELLAVAAVRLAERIIKAIDTREIDKVDVQMEMRRLVEVAHLGRELASRLPSVGEPSWAAPREAPVPAAPVPHDSHLTVLRPDALPVAA